MSSLFRDLNRAAIEADLGKNAFKVFNTLLEQTLGYGKSSDRLTNRQLCRLSHVRMDRFVPALQTVLSSGIFEQRPAKKFQYRYTIGKSFLEKNGDKDFFTPALPKKRTDFQKTETISEKETHTALDLNPSLSSLLQPLQTLLSFSTEMLQQQMQQQAQFIQTLLQTQQNTATNPENAVNPTVAGFNKPKPPTATPITVVNIPPSPVDLSYATSNPTHISESQLGQPTTHIPTSNKSNKTFSKTDRKTENSATVSNTDPKTEKQPSVKQRESDVVGINVNNQEQQQSVSAAESDHNGIIPLPDALAEGLPSEDYPEAYQLLIKLSEQQQKNVFAVYQDVSEREGVGFPISLLRNLVNKAKRNALILPKSLTDTNDAHQPTHPSMVIESSADRLARQDREDEEEAKSLRKMLQDESELTGVSVEELANKMRLNYLFF